MELSEEFRRYVRAVLAPPGTTGAGAAGGAVRFDDGELAERMAAAMDGKVPPG